MTPQDMQKLSVGDRIASPYDTPTFRVRRVTHVWHNPESGCVRVIIAGLDRTEWIEPSTFVRAPSKAVSFDYRSRRFLRYMTPKELAALPPRQDGTRVESLLVPVGPEVPR